MIPIVSFVGYSNSGKTTLLTALVRELKQRNYRVAVIKHDVHGFTLDQPGKDTWLHAEAGADIVCIGSPYGLAMFEKVEQELPLERIAERITNVDLILTEGFKRAGAPKVEVFRQAAGNEPLGQSPELLAVVSDMHLYKDIPHFSFEEVGLIANLLEGSLNLSDKKGKY